MFRGTFVYKPAAATGRGCIRTVNRSVAVRTTVGQWQGRAIVMPGMALQAQRRFTHAQQIGVGRSVGRVAAHAVLGHRRMLVSERSAILRVATEAQLVRRRGAQIVARRSTMWVVAVRTTHFSFAQRVVVGQAHLSALGLVTSEAGIIGLPAGLHDRLRLRHETFHMADTRRRRHIETRVTLCFTFYGVVVSLVAFGTTKMVGSVRSCHPVAQVRITRMATEADPVRVVWRPLPERNDLRHIAAAVNMQASRAVALLAFHSLLGMKGMLVILGDLRVARGTHFGARLLGAGNLRVLRKRSDLRL